MIITSLYRNGRRWPPSKPPRQIITLSPLMFRPVGALRHLTQTPHGVYEMANMMMNEAATSIMNRNIDLIADTIKVALLTAVYVANRDDQFIDAAGASDYVDARAAGTTDQALAGRVIGKDNTGDFGYFDANDVNFVAVPAGTPITQVGCHKDTGTPTTSKIVGIFDIADITPNGGDITIQWAVPASGGLMKLAT